MAGTKKITQLTAATDVANNDLFVMVDISDDTQSDEGTTKKVTLDTLADSLTVSSKCVVNGSFFDNSIRDVYLPVGNTETEYTTIQRSSQLMVGFSGQLLQVNLRSWFAAPSSGTLSLTLRLVSSTSNATTDIETITITPTYAGYMENVFTFTSAAALLAGRTYAFYLENDLNAALGNCSFSITYTQ